MTSPQERCHFWRLPLEVRQMIYDLVYGRGKKFNPERTTREIMELTPYGRVHFVKVLPTKEYPLSFHEERAVNRQFLAETMHRLAETSKVFFYHGALFYQNRISRIFLQNMRSLVVIWSAQDTPETINFPALYPRLRSLTVYIESIYIKELWCQEAPSAEVLKNMALVRSFSLLRGVERFSITDGCAEYDNFAEEGEEYVRPSTRVKQLEDIMRRMVTRAKVEEKTEIHPEIAQEGVRRSKRKRATGS